MSFLKKISFIAILFLLNGCFYTNSYYPIGPTNTQINNSKSIQKATMRPYTINGKTYYPTVVKVGDTQRGIASWYGPNFHGKKTSNGEIFNMYNLTAAHKTLPMNTIVKVTNLNNGKNITVRINDRGPFVSNRIIDLSKAAAEKISMISTGTAPVILDIVGFASQNISEQKNYPSNQSQSIVGGNFMVQIGAFRNKNGAIIYQNQHKQILGYKSIIKTYIIDNLKMYRVFLTGFKSEDEARDFAKSGHFNGAYILRD
ncbi:rare lipoprotein A [Campylobacter pinnipediorum subsp. caledonicus]|nr:rare lipoprotein A [Campylobacter pinnipediorum subsp. caledonicus]